MKISKWLIVPYLSILVLCISCSANEYSRSTDEIFANFISKHSGNLLSDKAFTHIENSDLKDLKESSLFPDRSLIVTVVNLSDSFEEDTEKLYKLIGLLIEKGESVAELGSTKCNFVDQLIMKADIKLFRYLLAKGLKVPKDRNCTIEVLEKYKFRYDGNSYKTMRSILSS